MNAPANIEAAERDAQLHALMSRRERAFKAVRELRQMAMEQYATAPESKEFGDAIRAVNAARGDAITAGMLVNLLMADPKGELFSQARELADRLAKKPDDFYRSIRGTPFLSEALGRAVRGVDAIDPQPQAKPDGRKGMNVLKPSRRELGKIVSAATIEGMAAGFTNGMLNDPKRPVKNGAVHGVFGAVGGRAVGHAIAAYKHHSLAVALSTEEFANLAQLIRQSALDGEQIDANAPYSPPSIETIESLIEKQVDTDILMTHMLHGMNNPKLEKQWDEFQEKLSEAVELNQQGYKAKEHFSICIRHLQFFRDDWDAYRKNSVEPVPDKTMAEADRRMEQLEHAISAVAGVSRTMAGGVGAFDR